MVLRRAAFAGACLLILVAERVAAAGEPGPSLTLRAVIERALQHRPELAAFQYRFRALDARLAQAGFAPVTQLEGLVEDVAGTGQRSGLKSAQTSLLLSRVLELGGKSDARRDVVSAETERLRVEEAAVQLDVVANVGRRFVEVLEGQARLELAAESVRIAEQSEERVAERVRASRSPPAESARAGVQTWEARLIFEDAEHELEIDKHELAAAMGERSVAFARVEGDLLALQPVADLPELVRRVEKNPDVRRFATEARVRQAEVRLAELQQRADPRVTFGVRRFEQGNDFGLVAGVTIPLYSGRRAQPQIEAARAERERVPVDREALVVKLDAAIFSQYTQLNYEVGLSQTLRDELIPRLQTALEQTTFAYERGRYSYLEWITARSGLLEGRLRLIESAARYHLLRIEIERLTGESLESVGDRP